MARVTTFRIARETAHYPADDLSGAGAAHSGGRWNRIDIPMVYTSMSRALAALETVVHLSEPKASPLPLDRYLIAVTIPEAEWNAREIFNRRGHRRWDAIPESKTGLDWGTAWAAEKRSLVAIVPSVIVPEECNVLLNPMHPKAGRLHAPAGQQRKWLYDPRLGLIE